MTSIIKRIEYGKGITMLYNESYEKRSYFNVLLCRHALRHM